jgi:twinkle protein
MSISSNVEKLIVNDEQIENYFAERDLTEHTKIKSPSNYAEDVLEYFKNDMTGGVPLPFDFTEDKFKIRKGETTIVSGYSGHGKTIWLSYVMYKALNYSKVLIASFEMLPKATLGRMLQQTGNYEPTDNAVYEFVESLDNKLYLYDAEGETSVEKVLSVIYYAKEKLGIDMFVIDSLMKCGINEDDYNGQKRFVNQLCVASRDLGIHIFLVAHSRKTVHEHSEPSKFDVLGSSNITNLADNCITVFRNKKKEEILSGNDEDKIEEVKKHYDCKIYINKQRHGNGYEGNFGLYFDKKTLTFGVYNNDNSKPVYQANEKSFF